MIRITLIAVAALATIATASSGCGPGRRAGPHAWSRSRPSADASDTVAIAERKAAPCADKSCASKPLKRGYVAAAPFGW